MKLKDYLKQFENLDPELEVDQNGKAIAKIDIAYQKGYEATSLKENPFKINTSDSNSFIKGYQDKQDDLDDEIFFPD